MAPFCQRLLTGLALAALRGGFAARVSDIEGVGKERPTFTAEEATVKSKHASAGFALRDEADAVLQVEACIEASAPGNVCPMLLAFVTAALELKEKMDSCPTSEDGGIAAYFNQLGHKTIEEFREPRPKIWITVHDKDRECDKLGAEDEIVAMQVIKNVRMKSKDMYWDANDIGTAMQSLEDIKELLLALNAATSGSATSPKDFIDRLAPKIALSDSFDRAASAKKSYDKLQQQWKDAQGAKKTSLKGRMDRAKKTWDKAQKELDK
mmetsp:Transcript_18515/g.41931  ORF Transcript_18515/g.41931 Transcript_18515/m.41931 type:complete len:266 (-) Transcript_18515:95-892(-)